MEKITKIERRGLFEPLKFHMALPQLCKNTLAYLSRKTNASIIKRRK
jgi:hypothetical protein